MHVNVTVGTLTACGVRLVVHGNRLSSLPTTVADAAGALCGGALVNVTPEGTT